MADDTAAALAAALEQLTFDGTVNCAAFNPNPWKADICNDCSHTLLSHRREAVTEAKHVTRAIQAKQDGVPTVVVAATEGRGALFHGGYKAVMNRKFLDEHNITHVVNTAKGLDMFGPRYTKAVQDAKGRGIAFLELDWVDAEYQKIDGRIGEAVKFVHGGLCTNNGVLVHCAQGKSRSSCVVLAYLLASSGGKRSVAAALEELQEKRPMAQPNASFMSQLCELAQDGAFSNIIPHDLPSEL
eukprot:m.490974 g.490974  ORF g.490974 m.490974 type:complete len:242 (+) comp28977_c0_seq1:128-853(+)